MHARGPRPLSIRASAVPEVALLLVPGAMTVALAFQSGGHGTRATSVAAVEMAVLLAVWLVLAQSPLHAVTRTLAIAVTALVGLAGWAALSATWSLSVERAAPEAVRTLLYATTLALFGLVATTPRRVRILALGLAGGCVAISVAALASRTLPDLIARSPGYSLDQLAYPLSYWNGLGLLAAVGSVLCLHLTCRADEPAWVRRLAAAGLPLLVATLYATLSRGAAVAALVGICLYLLLARPAGLLAVAIAVAPSTAAALAAVQVTTADRFVALAPDPTTMSNARWISIALAACALAAGVLRGTADAALAHRLGDAPRWSPRTIARRDAVAVAVLAAVVAVALVEAVRDTERYHAPSGEAHVGPARLLSTGSSGRSAYWEVALDAAADRPLIGKGAGTFELVWVRHRETARLFARNAHSLYLETLAELGAVGLALLLTGLATMAVGLMRQARRGSPDRALWVALLAASAAWSVHAAVDWNWELPAVSLWVFAIGGAALAQQPDPPRARPGRYMRRAVARWALVATCVFVAVISARLAIAAAQLDAAVHAAEDGDCEKAEARADVSLRWRDQSGPYVVLAWCRRNSSSGAAKRAMVEAVERNPQDWRLHYDFALVLAYAGEDPRAEAEAARVLNPLGPGVREAAVVFARGTRASRRAYARNAQFLLR